MIVVGINVHGGSAADTPDAYRAPISGTRETLALRLRVGAVQCSVTSNKQIL